MKNRTIYFPDIFAKKFFKTLALCMCVFSFLNLSSQTVSQISSHQNLDNSSGTVSSDSKIVISGDAILFVENEIFLAEDFTKTEDKELNISATKEKNLLAKKNTIKKVKSTSVKTAVQANKTICTFKDSNSNLYNYNLAFSRNCSGCNLNTQHKFKNIAVELLYFKNKNKFSSSVQTFYYSILNCNFNGGLSATIRPPPMI